MSLDSKELVKGLKTASGQLKGFDQKLKSTGKALTTKVSAPLTVLGGLAIRQSMKFERLKTSLNVLTGSAESGGAAFEKLVQFSAKTPFQLDELAKVNNTLMGFGLNAEQSRESLKLLGDIAAVSGGSLQGIGIAFGQSAAEGRIMTRDLLQFINNGVPMIKLLSNELGVSSAEIRKLASEGQLSFPIVVSALQKATAEGGMFANGMQVLSGTLGGVASTLKDNLNIALSELGGEIVKAFDLVNVGKQLTEFIGTAVDKFKGLSSETKRLIIVIGGIAAAIGPLALLIGTVISPLTKAFEFLGGTIGFASKMTRGLFTVLMTPAGLITAGLIAVSAAITEILHSMIPVTSKLNTFINFIKSGGNAMRFAALQAKSAAEEQKQVADSIDQVNEAQKKLASTGATTPGLEEFTGSVTQNAREAVKSVLTFQKVSAKTLDVFNGKGFEAAATIKRIKEKSSELAQTVTVNFKDIAMTIGTTFGQALANGGNGFKALGASIFTVLGDILMQMGATAIAASNLAKTFAIPGVGVAAGVAAVALGAFIKSLAGKMQTGGPTAFANGGIVSGPTLGLIGEYSGARSNPEVVAPLDKLKGMIGQQGQNVNVGGEFRIQGQDLVLALQRAERERNRLL